MRFWRFASIILALAMLPLVPGGNAYAAALGTEFTYQGRLTSSGTAVDQTCGFQFSLFDAASGGSQQGSTLTKGSVSVSDGLFKVSLDFGTSIFTGDATFLNITVRCPDSGSYTSLTPRQELSPTPYSVFATTAGGVQDKDNDTKIQAEETADEDKIRFDTGGSERMIIDAGGLVGIGTSSPVSPLDVAGVAHIVTLGVSGNATFADTILLANTETTFSTSAFTVTTSVTSAGNTVFDLDAGGNLSIDGEFTSGNLTSGALTVDTDTLSVDSTNNRVGIGTTGPTQGKLVIAQTDGANLEALFIDSLESTFSQSVLTVTTSVTGAGNTVFDLDSGGNLSIDGRLESSRVRVLGGVLARGGGPGAFGLSNNGYAFASGGGDNDSGMFSDSDNQVNFYTNATEGMRITGDNVTAAGTINAGGLDLAENFLTDDKSLVPGEIVTFDPFNATTHIIRASSADSRILGVVSTDPGLLLGYTFNPDNFDESRLRPVALSGRVPVKVSTDNGNIVVGDSLSISSQPGVAQRANAGEQTIGYALEEYSGREIGEIKVFVNLAQGTQNLQSRVHQLEQENSALKQLVCADHRGAEICQKSSAPGEVDTLSAQDHAGGPALWVVGSIGVALAALGTVFLFATRWACGDRGLAGAS